MMMKMLRSVKRSGLRGHPGLQRALRPSGSLATHTSEKPSFVSAAVSPIRDCDVKQVSLSQKGRQVEVDFSDGTSFTFHGLWLRDACRGKHWVAEVPGEKILSRIPTATGCDGTVRSAAVRDGELEILWGSSASSTSNFSGGFLRMYAPIVGKPSKQTVEKPLEAQHHEKKADFKWLEPYSGFHGVPAPAKDQLELWKNQGVRDQFQHRDFTKVRGDNAANLEMMKALMRHGVLIIDGVPAVSDGHDGSLVRDFTDSCLGGMQKDPARTDANWVITRKEAAQSVSYAQDLRLNNHSDQSVPAHGIPALCLVVHYVEGTGTNTLVDAYAVAEAIRERDPAAFKMLTTYGSCQERDYVRSRVDSTQAGTQGMLISTKKPIIQLDHLGQVVRAQYNEVFRTPVTLSFDKFEDWFRAYSLWVEMIHGPEFEVEVPISAGQMLVLDNWRVLHGRAGGKSSPNRTIMGGTVVREAFMSRAIQLMGATYPVPDYA
ncbi:unnamed protein product [Polarella glacialis]|uniref:trimethyllysine dioxygenase n=1 Tax=Polarella glacialis TaxID=89957 RepID=A0A813J8V3_POLGL|nr:unnamed protein product [Polarella glacialis]CAE8670951.1 unnamed protein product [Polarella glacialis]